jgi:hypothetical protein
VSKSAFDNSKMVSGLLGSETGLEQVVDDLKCISGNGRNGRIYIKDEF